MIVGAKDVSMVDHPFPSFSEYIRGISSIGGVDVDLYLVDNCGSDACLKRSREKRCGRTSTVLSTSFFGRVGSGVELV